MPSDQKPFSHVDEKRLRFMTRAKIFNPTDRAEDAVRKDIVNNHSDDSYTTDRGKVSQSDEETCDVTRTLQDRCFHFCSPK